ncbi:uncharacterized protein TRUGW13939_11838 [Talaromyces rugulosus]|uniref:Xylanolytic transcriptional activator regulatory domain-containing protein n=1 Tax=Talaromyces rugulosus TaxID=121627 RepID=A0A7H8RDU4_TALRU|nr:uncharacterized protein TRUGW13939_11838 [Talaromyces rugulosus]QKX64662.1 hypothetical protein TRUGW13939_11838 [Talaromyces rugulosus]
MLFLIVGISGNLGLKLADALIRRGHQVRGASRSKSSVPEKDLVRLESFYQTKSWCDADTLRQAVRGVDTVICAYTPIPCLALEAELLLVRIMEEEGRFVPSAWNLDWSQLEWGQVPYYDVFLALKRQLELSSTVKPLYIFVGILCEVFFSVPDHGGFAPANQGVWDPAPKRAVVWGSGHEKWQITTEYDAAEFTAELIQDLSNETGIYRFCSFEKSTREMAEAYERARGVKVTIDTAGSLEDLKVTARNTVEKLGLQRFWEWMGYFYQIYQLNGTFHMKNLDNDRYTAVDATSLESVNERCDKNEAIEPAVNAFISTGHGNKFVKAANVCRVCVIAVIPRGEQFQLPDWLTANSTVGFPPHTPPEGLLVRLHPFSLLLKLSRSKTRHGSGRPDCQPAEKQLRASAEADTAGAGRRVHELQFLAVGMLPVQEVSQPFIRFAPDTLTRSPGEKSNGSNRKRKASNSQLPTLDKECRTSRLREIEGGYQRSDCISTGASRPLRHQQALRTKGSSISNWIFHHFHERQAYRDDSENSRKVSPSPEAHFLPTPPEVVQQNNIACICHILGLEQSQLSRLTDLYFLHITSISLFHRPTFERRVYVELMPEQASTLLASMFCLASRYAQSGDGIGALLPECFYEIASDATHKQLRSCGDRPPQLFLLQALVLTTYNELVTGVRGVAWRSLGLVIRIAYEMGLHLVDMPSRSMRKDDPESVEVWISKEERRRLWWTIWELEVFATTIRRCPIGMDQSQHATLLPVEDTFWFDGKKSPSCFLDADPTLRWKNLQRSGNEHSRTWFIVINSFMYDAHSLANPSVPHDVTFGRGQPSDDQRHSHSADIGPQLVVLENCVSCYSMALPKQLHYPPDLSYSNETTFCDSMKRKRDSDIQAIHVMTQLAKLMVLHNDCFRDERSGAGSQTEEVDRTSSSPMREAPRPVDEAATHLNTLSPRYLRAAEQVVNIVRDATPYRISDGDPLLANTFWMVAAIQIVQATFAETQSERLVAQSNLDLLRLTLIQHRDFWNTSSILVQNLDNLEDAMEKVHSRVISLVATRSQTRTYPPSPDEERVHYGSDIALTQNSNFAGGLNMEPLTQGQDASGELPEAEVCPNSGVISFDDELPPCDTTLVGDSGMGLSMDLSIQAIISGAWETSNDLFYNTDILENSNYFS